MAKLNKVEFTNKYANLIKDGDDEKLMGFLEDVSDSIEVSGDSEEVEKLKSELEEAKTKLDNAETEKELLKEKYINRFMSSESTEPKLSAGTEPEPKEVNVIDIKEI